MGNMKIAVLGTGSVGQTFADKLVALGHDVMIGTRNVQEASNRTARDFYGNPGFGDWLKSNSGVKLGTFAQAVAFGEVVINATLGGNSVQALKSAGSEDLKDKIIIDISNPLDFSKGMPPTLIPGLSNTNSVGEELQKAFPQAHVVKTLNTMWCGLMVNPGMIGGGNHINFLSGNSQEAKTKVKQLLKEFGWKNENLLDLGDITSARGTEGMMPIWLRVWASKKTGAFNFAIIP
jgi:8-hydroxy-5-deazaflavin:NADPH oxidoreductase